MALEISRFLTVTISHSNRTFPTSFVCVYIHVTSCLCISFSFVRTLVCATFAVTPRRIPLQPYRGHIVEVWVGYWGRDCG